MSGTTAPEHTLGTVEILGLALGTGLAGGLLEGASHFARARFLDTNLPLGIYMLWMPAAANGAFFLGIGLLIAALSRFLPRSVTPARATGLFVLLAVMAALRAFDNSLSILTVDLLALGAAVQAGRWAGRHWNQARRAIPRWVAGLGCLVAALATGIEARFALAERRMLATLPAAGPGQPNVLLLVLDTVRRFNLSTYGYARATSPTLSALAERGVLFEDVVAPSPWTLPSHASIMTGRWAHELSASWSTPLDHRDSTLAEALDSRGYRTAGFVANISYAGQSAGISRGFSHFDGVRLTPTQIARSAAFTSWLTSRRWMRPLVRPHYKSTDRKSAGEVNDAFLEWLGRGGDRPFFAFLNYFDAHDPYLPQPPFDTAFAATSYPPLPPPAHPGGHHDATPRSQREYDEAIAYVDHEIGRLLAELERRGLLASTLVIVTSDHGEEFGEHGMYGHGHTLYMPGLAVPLAIALPGRVPAGLRVKGMVSLRDLAATVMDLATGKGGAPFPGVSLAGFWGEARTTGDTLLVETRLARGRPDWDATSFGDLQGALFSWKTFLRDGARKAEFYDLSVDPDQTHNLVSPGGAGDSLTTALQDLLDRRMGPPVYRPGPVR